MIRCVAIPAADIGRVWHLIEPDVERALDYAQGEMLGEDVRAGIEAGHMLAVLFYQDDEYLAVAVAELIDRPRMRVCNVPILAGKRMDLWLGYGVEQVSRVAKEHGAQRLYGCGRTGWTRALAPHGFKPAYTLTARTL